mmetsp:Transcript_103929/g.299246  ORF Transcript_103929/g.299246 Transcript_103929/m.299246 type:complete len:682 (-) Transcript_103929:123-2168(-)
MQKYAELFDAHEKEKQEKEALKEETETLKEGIAYWRRHAFEAYGFLEEFQADHQHDEQEHINQAQCADYEHDAEMEKLEEELKVTANDVDEMGEAMEDVVSERARLESELQAATQKHEGLQGVLVVTRHEGFVVGEKYSDVPADPKEHFLEDPMTEGREDKTGLCKWCDRKMTLGGTLRVKGRDKHLTHLLQCPEVPKEVKAALFQLCGGANGRMMDLGHRLRIWKEANDDLAGLVYMAWEPVKPLEMPAAQLRHGAFRTVPYWHGSAQAWKVKLPQFYVGASYKPLLEAMKREDARNDTRMYHNYDEALSTLTMAIQEFERRCGEEQVKLLHERERQPVRFNEYFSEVDLKKFDKDINLRDPIIPARSETSARLLRGLNASEYRGPPRDIPLEDRLDMLCDIINNSTGSQQLVELLLHIMDAKEDLREVCRHGANLAHYCDEQRKNLDVTNDQFIRDHNGLEPFVARLRSLVVRWGELGGHLMSDYVANGTSPDKLRAAFDTHRNCVLLWTKLTALPFTGSNGGVGGSVVVICELEQQGADLYAMIIADPYYFNIAYLVPRSLQRLAYEALRAAGKDVEYLRALLWLLCYTHRWALYFYDRVFSPDQSIKVAVSEVKELYMNELRLVVLTTSADKKGTGNDRQIMGHNKAFADFKMGGYFQPDYIAQIYTENEKRSRRRS